MRYKVGAEQLQQVPTLVHRPDTAFRASRTAPAGPTHAVSTRTGEAACGITVDGLEVLDQDWEEAFFVEKAASPSPPMTLLAQALRRSHDRHRDSYGISRAFGLRS
jgi:hypothetical protein